MAGFGESRTGVTKVLNCVLARLPANFPLCGWLRMVEDDLKLGGARAKYLPRRSSIPRWPSSRLTPEITFHTCQIAHRRPNGLRTLRLRK